MQIALSYKVLLFTFVIFVTHLKVNHGCNTQLRSLITKALSQSKSGTGRSAVLDQFLNFTSESFVWKTPECIHDTKQPIYIEETNAVKTCLKEWKTTGSRDWSVPNPEWDKRVDQVIIENGYSLEKASITSDDGYITTLFRVRSGPRSPLMERKPTVILVHGLGAGSDQWILQHGNKNLLFRLVDAHYDVWIVNVRGTDFSRGHVRLTDESEEYWEFGLDEIGVYDIPPIIDYVQSVSRQEKVQIICHSMGCAVLAIGIAEYPRLNDKLYASYYFAPGLFVGHLYNPLGRFLKAVYLLYPALALTVAGELIQQRLFTPLVPVVRDAFCFEPITRCTLCTNMYFYLYGYNVKQMNFTNMPNLFKTYNTFSSRTILHFSQNYESCMFRKYNFENSRENYKAYGDFIPPPHNLSALTAPIHIYFGESDNFVSPLDAAVLRDALPKGTVRGFHRIAPYFNHVDFMVSTQADRLVYDPVIKQMEKYVNSENMIDPDYD